MMLVKYRYLLVFILLILLIPFLVFILKGELMIPLDLGIIFALDLCLFIILKNKLEINSIKKRILVIITLLISISSPIWFLVLIFFSPAQKEADRIFFDVCIPAVQKYYEDKGLKQEDYFYGPVDEKGNSRYNHQVLECEKNVHEGKGPIFSESPPGFKLPQK